MADDDPIAKWRRPGGSPPLSGRETGGAAVSQVGIKLREYKAFTTAPGYTPGFLLLKRALVKKAETDIGLSYTYLTDVISDGYGFVFSLTFCLPFPKPVVVRFVGEGMLPILDAILKRTATEVQIFDSDKFIPPPEGTFEIEADEWRGGPIIKDITLGEIAPEKNKLH